MREAPQMRVLALGSYYNQDARDSVPDGDWESLNFARVVYAVKEGGAIKFRGFTRRAVGGGIYTIGD